MPIEYDWSNVRDFEALHSDPKEMHITKAFFELGWDYGLFDKIGFNRITAENAGEVWSRLSVMQGLIGGAFFNLIADGKSTPIAMTAEDVIRRIGMRSNYCNLTRAQWLTKYVKPVMDSVAKDTLERVPEMVSS